MCCLWIIVVSCILISNKIFTQCVDGITIFLFLWFLLHEVPDIIQQQKSPWQACSIWSLSVNQWGQQDAECSMGADIVHPLTHLPLVPHICISESTQHWFRYMIACCLVGAKPLSKLIGRLWTNFSEIFIKTQKFSFTKMHLKRSSVKWGTFCPGGIYELSQVGQLGDSPSWRAFTLSLLVSGKGACLCYLCV